MTSADVPPLVPLMILGAGAVIVMLLIAAVRNHKAVFGLTLAIFGLSLISLHLVAYSLPRQVTELLILDRYSHFFMGLLFAAGFAVTLISYSYFERQDGVQPEEFYVLLLIATLGSAVLVASSHFASFLLGLETLSISLYGLIAYQKYRERSIEAGIKYLILAAFSAALLFFGMALVYAQLGTMQIARISEMLGRRAGTFDVLLVGGMVLIILGIGFKLAVVPFHMWTPDIYEGAPAPAAAFVASVSKGGMFALLVRYYNQPNVHTYLSLFVIFSFIALASMIVGNLLALMQSNLKRLLAYSSIAHWGYLLVGFLAVGTKAVDSVAYYLASYFTSILLAFGIIAALSSSGEELENLEQYRGLFYRKPWMAGLLTVALLSLASIPLTAGFFGKYYVLYAAIGTASWLLVLTLVVTSGIGAYYYLRFVAVMGQPPSAEAASIVMPGPSVTGSLILTALTIMLFWLGIYPAPIVSFIESTVAGLL